MRLWCVVSVARNFAVTASITVKPFHVLCIQMWYKKKGVVYFIPKRFLHVFFCGPACTHVKKYRFSEPASFFL